MLENIILPSVVLISVFAFVAVAVWAEHRRKEREAFYRSEVLKKLADVTGEQAQQVLAALREDDANQDRRQREGIKLAGAIVTPVGLGICGMLYLMAPDHTWAVGLAPLTAGVGLLLYAFFLARGPKA